MRIHRAVVGDLVLVPPGFKSLQLHAEVPAAMTDIVDDQPGGRQHRAVLVRHHVDEPRRHDRRRASSPGTPSTSSGRRSTCPGLKENLYKLREVRRILFDRDSRPYFGDLAEVAERGEEVPVLGPPDMRQLLPEMFVVGTVKIGPNVVNDGAVVMSENTMAEVFGPWWADRPAFIAHPARARRRSGRRCATSSTRR